VTITTIINWIQVSDVIAENDCHFYYGAIIITSSCWWTRSSFAGDRFGPLPSPEKRWAADNCALSTTTIKLTPSRERETRTKQTGDQKINGASGHFETGMDPAERTPRIITSSRPRVSPRCELTDARVQRDRESPTVDSDFHSERMPPPGVHPHHRRCGQGLECTWLQCCNCKTGE